MPRVRITATVITDDGEEDVIMDDEVFDFGLIIAGQNAEFQSEVGVDGNSMRLQQFAANTEHLAAMYGVAINRSRELNPGFTLAVAAGMAPTKVVETGREDSHPIEPSADDILRRFMERNDDGEVH